MAIGTTSYSRVSVGEKCVLIMNEIDKMWFGRTSNRDTLSHVHNIGTPLVGYYEHLLDL